MNDWTKPAFAFIVLAIAAGMLWTKALSGAEFVSLASATMWAFMLGQVAAVGAQGLVTIGAKTAEAKATEATAKLAAVTKGTQP